MACHDCGLSFEELEPRSFSFNSPFGACPDCSGIGTKLEVDDLPPGEKWEDKIIAKDSKICKVKMIFDRNDSLL